MKSERHSHHSHHFLNEELEIGSTHGTNGGGTIFAGDNFSSFLESLLNKSLSKGSVGMRFIELYTPVIRRLNRLATVNGDGPTHTDTPEIIKQKQENYKILSTLIRDVGYNFDDQKKRQQYNENSDKFTDQQRCENKFTDSCPYDYNDFLQSICELVPAEVFELEDKFVGDNAADENAKEERSFCLFLFREVLSSFRSEVQSDNVPEDNLLVETIMDKPVSYVMAIVWVEIRKTCRIGTYLHILFKIDYYNRINNKFRYADPKQFTLWDGVMSFLTGSYIRNTWEHVVDPSALADDINTLCVNLALVGALVITMVFPMFQSAGGMLTGDETDAQLRIWYAYLGMIALSGCMESTCVLISIRNMIVINLVPKSRLKAFVNEVSGTLMFPVKINMFAILCFLLALILFGFFEYGVDVTMPFILAIVLPCVLTLAITSARGVEALYHVKPWFEPHRAGEKDDTNKEFRRGLSKFWEENDGMAPASSAKRPSKIIPRSSTSEKKQIQLPILNADYQSTSSKVAPAPSPLSPSSSKQQPPTPLSQHQQMRSVELVTPANELLDVEN